jgi:hypothetical protein
MRLNIFEGARRIALVCGVLWVGGCIAYAVFNEPQARMVFSVAGVGDPPVVATECGGDDAAKYVPRGDTVPLWVTLCFTAQRANDGRMLVPYPSNGVSVRMPDGTIIEGVPEGLSKADMTARLKAGNVDIEKMLIPQPAPLPGQPAVEPKKFQMFALGEPWSENVRTYTDGVVARFVFPADARAEAERRNWDVRAAQWKTTSLVMLGGLAVGWLLVATFGWVIRGFLGIPRGQDVRPTA